MQEDAFLQGGHHTPNSPIGRKEAEPNNELQDVWGRCASWVPGHSVNGETPSPELGVQHPRPDAQDLQVPTGRTLFGSKGQELYFCAL